MEWKTKPKFKSGMTRERLKFAWLPADCEDGKTRWLCKIRVIERYCEGMCVRDWWEVVKSYRAEVEGAA